jgi:hypothetical protein
MPVWARLVGLVALAAWAGWWAAAGVGRAAGAVWDEVVGR